MYLAPGQFTNWQLYNCCTDCQEPDWSQYDYLEVQPVIECFDDDGQCSCEVLPLDESDWADFWSIYARLPCGEVEVITDIKSESEIYKISQYLSKRSGLKLH